MLKYQNSKQQLFGILNIGYLDLFGACDFEFGI